MAQRIDAVGQASREALARSHPDGIGSPRILVIADRNAESESLLVRLSVNGYEAASSPKSPAQALHTIRAFYPNAVLMDACDRSACRELFAVVSTTTMAPVVVTGNGSEEQQVWYLEHGAAEYLVQPVSFSVLHAYLRAALRWGTPSPQHGVLRAGELELDEAMHEVRLRNRPIPMTPKEYCLLRALAEHKGKACSHRMLLEQVWGAHFTACHHYLRLYIGYLRQKLEDDPANPVLITTEWGIGYRLVDRGEALSPLQAQPASNAPGLAAG